MFGTACNRSSVLLKHANFAATCRWVSSSHRLFIAESPRPRPVADDSTSASKEFAERVAKVLYDGECNICMKEINILKRVASKRPVDFVDITAPGYQADKYSGITYEMAMKEMHVIGADGKVYTQGDAIREMYRACGLGWLAAATQVPGIELACNKLYVKFAEYRLQKALDRCDSGSCSVKLKHLREKLRP
ncbi:hypothetical protein BaRGS_00005413 [Batillaria attramentaria]|uniref:Thiol-disulfide oxidoreductase DCC n=1 Tax=Batillaria attramentaria TaxID=370345 RepID=A0ABD0LVF8_9CAEN